MHDVFFFTDIHGMYDLYRAIMDYCNEQDPEAMIIFGGDAIDRGLHGYKIMKELLNTPRVIYLKGNHEDMFVRAAQEIQNEFTFNTPTREYVRRILNSCCLFDDKYRNIQSSIFNGGIETLTDWIMDGMPMELVERVNNLPYTFTYNNCDFCHAAGIYNTFRRADNAEYEGKAPHSIDATSLLWTRGAFNVGWKTGRIAVFGHTPVQCLNEFMDTNVDVIMTPYKWIGQAYDDMLGPKIDMDTGAAFYGKAYVLNILTMQAHGFHDYDFKNDEIRKHDVEKIEVIQF